MSVFRELPLEKIEKRFFFETDLLFHLNIVRAVVKNIPMTAHYGNEVSGLKISRALPEFAWKHLRCMMRRYAYNYWLRDVNVGTLYSFFGILLTVFGVTTGTESWMQNVSHQTLASSGTVMLAALPTLIGIPLIEGAPVCDTLHMTYQAPHEGARVHSVSLSRLKSPVDLTLGTLRVSSLTPQAGTLTLDFFCPDGSRLQLGMPRLHGISLGAHYREKMRTTREAP
jgi:hypothetical protein